MQDKLEKFCDIYGEKCLARPHNPIIGYTCVERWFTSFPSENFGLEDVPCFECQLKSMTTK